MLLSVMCVMLFCLQCLERYRKLNKIDRAQQLWEFWYKHFEKGCIHGYQCSRRRDGQECNIGGRKHEVKMIGGAVLPIWKVGVACCQGTSWAGKTVKVLHTDASAECGPRWP